MIDELEQAAARLGRWFSQRDPELHDASVTGLVRSDAGYSNVTLLGRLQWTQSGTPRTQEIVLRLQPESSSVYPDCDIARQYRVMQALAASEVPVPQLLGFEPDPRLLGAPFFVMRRIAGRVPNENPLYHLDGWFHDLSPEAVRQHWFSGVDAVAAVARVDWRERGLAFLQPAAGQTALAQQLDYYRRAVEWAERLHRPYPHLHGAHAWLVANQPVDEPLALSWADAKLGNCVYDAEGRIAGLLDWEQATLASPVDDLAWWLMLDDSLSTGYGVPRLAALPSRAETVEHWERASGHSARHLPYYDVFAAWRMAYVMARIGTVFMERGWVPRASDMDLRNGGAALLAMHAARLGF